MSQADDCTRRMTIEVRSKGNVRQWTQYLTGLPRKGDRLRWRCYQNEKQYLVVAEVRYLLWMTDDTASECLEPTVVCKLVGVFCENGTDDDEDKVWDGDDWLEDRADRDDEEPDDEDHEGRDDWTDLLT